MGIFKLNLSLKHNSKVLNTINKRCRHISSWEIRQIFLDYFIKEHNHKFVRSSSVVPFCDPTVAFVNAGMNQFKGIFLGNQNAKHIKVANSQKCVRVGGKHNDLEIVGTDGYHHTFFEMLGNWSFGDYFKEDAIKLAWYLLTGPYGINPRYLYVTYFGGDSKMNLEPDFEVRDIWKSLGVPADRILPFGPKENFWEMGTVGPCGPCTEIHVDHTKSLQNRSKFVNAGLENLTELWNIVFIQYNRKHDGEIEILPKFHVDTGLGFERLTALLQNKSSNYDTDVFKPIFEIMSKNCRNLPEYSGTFGKEDVNGLNTDYRVFADHSRMITACLADGMIPELNQKLRRVLRKLFYLSQTTFKTDKKLIHDVVNTVTDNLGDTYPEIRKNNAQILSIINYESEVYKTLRDESSKKWHQITKSNPNLKNFDFIEMPGLITAIDEINSQNINSITPEIAFKLYDSYGLDENTITKLSYALSLNFDSKNLESELKKARERSKMQNLAQIPNMTYENTPKTDDSFKYHYKSENGVYKFPEIQTTVNFIAENNEFTAPGTEMALILSCSNLYTDSGGQISDSGTIYFGDNAIFRVVTTKSYGSAIWHIGTQISGPRIKNGASGTLVLDEVGRLGLMSGHTALHLVNSALKNVLACVTCQKSSKVTKNYFNYDFGAYGRKVGVDDIVDVENVVRRVIGDKVDVRTRIVTQQEMLELDNLIFLPGEVYPENGVRIVEIESERCDFYSCEPCCGTHVLNTGDLEDISVINLKSIGRSTSSITVVTGKRAKIAQRNGDNLLNELKNIENVVVNNEFKTEEINEQLTKIRKKLHFVNPEEDSIIPVGDKQKCLELIQKICKQLKNSERELLRKFVDLEIKSILEMRNTNENKFIVHYLSCSSLLEDVPLSRATKSCPNLPILVISYSNDLVKARCTIPQNLTSSNTFSAETWLRETVAHVFKAPTHVPKGQNSKFVCNMQEKYINKNDWEHLLQNAIELAEIYAKNHL